ncbi:MAG: oxidoreductase domain protein [Bacteroidetes bacterium]|nr:oxidoreductase domain protein [Bacteroidota bacterium]
MIRFGILGTAAIARSFLGVPLCNAAISAVASRDAGRAASFAHEHGIPLHYGRYEDLLADPTIDAVYVPLPPAMHASWVVKAAEAGKHVLVEKPAAPASSDVQAMVDACRKHNVLYMEAFMYRFKTIHRRVREIVSSGVLGELRYIDFSWCFNMKALRRSAFRLETEAGGGALNDLGVYGVDFLRFLGLPAPVVLHASVQREKAGGVDMFSHAVLRTGGALMSLTCGFTCDANYYLLGGEKGSVHVPGSLSGRRAPNVAYMHFLEDDRRVEELFEAENPYAAELEYFADCILRGVSPEADGEGSLANVRILERIKAFAADNGSLRG